MTGHPDAILTRIPRAARAGLWVALAALAVRALPGRRTPSTRSYAPATAV
jgi:hypothetical protein